MLVSPTPMVSRSYKILRNHCRSVSGFCLKMCILLGMLEDIGIVAEIRTPVPSATSANNILLLDSMNGTILLDL